MTSSNPKPKKIKITEKTKLTIIEELSEFADHLVTSNCEGTQKTDGNIKGNVRIFFLFFF